MVLTREADKPHLPPHLLQRHKELLCLLDGTAQVLLAVQDQQRGADIAYISHRRIAPVQLGVLPWSHPQIGVARPDVAGPILAIAVIEATLWHCRDKPIGVTDDPAREIAAIAAAD